MKNLAQYKWYRRITLGIWYFTNLHGWVREESISPCADIFKAESYECTLFLKLRKDPI
jgi:hypothetical protein